MNTKEKRDQTEIDDLLSEINGLHGTYLIDLNAGVPFFNESGRTLTKVMREGTQRLFFHDNNIPKKFQEILNQYPDFIAQVEATASGFILHLNSEKFGELKKVLAEISKEVIESYRGTFNTDGTPNEDEYKKLHQDLQDMVSNFAVNRQEDLLKVLHPDEDDEKIRDRIDRLKHITLADIYASVVLVLGLNTEIDDQVISIIRDQIDEQTTHVPKMKPVLEKLVGDSNAQKRSSEDNELLLDLIAVLQSIHTAWDSFQGFRQIHQSLDSGHRNFINRDVYDQFSAFLMAKFEQGFRKVIPEDSTFHNQDREKKEKAQETGMALAIIEVLKDFYFILDQE